MDFLKISLFIVCQFIIGFGLLSILKIRYQFLIQLSLSLLLGVFIMSFIPFLIELLKIPLSESNVFIGLAIGLIACNANFKQILSNSKYYLQNSRVSLKLYEIPGLLAILYFLIPSFWRSYYLPCNSRDFLSGPEAIASYAVREFTMINSLFSINLESTNNPFKSPFLTTLQIIYKHLGLEFGQVWLITITVAITILLYQLLSKRIHRFIVPIIIILFLANREMHAYTFMALYDFPNAVYYCLGSFFLFTYINNHDDIKSLCMASLFFAISIFIRTETLILIGLNTTLLLYVFIKYKNLLKLIKDFLILLIPSVLVYFLLIEIYNGMYLPVSYDLGTLFNEDLLNINQFIDRIVDIVKHLLPNTYIFGYLFYLFIVIATMDIIINKGLKKKQSQLLLFLVIIIVGIAFIAHLFPLFDLVNSSKRALFKFYPIIILYLIESPTLHWLSHKLNFLYNDMKEISTQS